MRWLRKVIASPAWVFLSITAAALASGFVMHKHSKSNQILLQKYLESLPAISLEMVRAQSTLEAAGTRVLTPAHIDMLEESLTRLLTSQYSSFEPCRLAMKIEILRNSQAERQGYDRELHRFGYEHCEPDVQLIDQIENLAQFSLWPQYQVTLCYRNKDDTTTMFSASSINEGNYRTKIFNG